MKPNGEKPLPSSVKSEHWEQREFVSWFRRTFPGILIYSNPNGGKRDKITAAKLSVEGLVAGVPDLFIPRWKLYIEMKATEGGVVSAAQKKIIKQLKADGYHVHVCPGFESAKEVAEIFGRAKAGNDKINLDPSDPINQ